MVSGVGDADDHHPRTQVRYGQGEETAAGLLARYLDGSAQLVPDVDLDGGEVVLTTGDDFGGVLTVPADPSPATSVPPVTVPPAEPEAVAVRVLNGTRVEGQASEVADGLEDVGFSVVGTGDWDELVEETIAYYAPGTLAAAEAVAAHLDAGARLVEDPSLTGDAVVLVTGSDFTGVGDGEGTDPLPDGAPPATPTTTTSMPGVVPGDPPPGVDCG